MDEKTHLYDDIIGLPRPGLHGRRRMSAYDRAAQFSSFAALTGFDDQVDEAARLTDRKLVPDPDRTEKIDLVLQFLADNPEIRHEIRIVHFVPDETKSGGSYATAEGKFKRIDEYALAVVLTDGTAINISDIWDISVKGLVVE